MSLLSIDTRENNALFPEREVIRMDKESEQGNIHITQEMSQNEIAEVISDHLMTIIKKQFKDARKAFQEASQK